MTLRVVFLRRSPAHRPLVVSFEYDQREPMYSDDLWAIISVLEEQTELEKLNAVDLVELAQKILRAIGRG